MFTRVCLLMLLGRHDRRLGLRLKRTEVGACSAFMQKPQRKTHIRIPTSPWVSFHGKCQRQLHPKSGVLDITRLCEHVQSVLCMSCQVVPPLTSRHYGSSRQQKYGRGCLVTASQVNKKCPAVGGDNALGSEYYGRDASLQSPVGKRQEKESYRSTLLSMSQPTGQ